MSTRYDLADELAGVQRELAAERARSERLREALDKVVGEALRFMSPSGDLDALEIGIIALSHTAPDQNAVADSLRFVGAIREARTALADSTSGADTNTTGQHGRHADESQSGDEPKATK